ncbi:MAG: hypothetical protein H6706_15415 [Myxococcales bacterium]|nr:hypothetical protein [Myxococcales bacterium]
MRPALLLAILLVGGAARAQGPTSTCVEVLGAPAELGDLRRLVMTELDRHPTHRAAEADCSSFLRVEVLVLAGSQYLTGRINTQVPHREVVEDGDIARAVERMLRVVLHNDPVRLRGPRDEGWLRAGIAALRGGRMVYGIEAFQLMAPLDGGLESMPGLAVMVRREVASWHLAARLSYAGRTAGAGPDLHLVGDLGLQLHLAWFLSPEADTAFYLGGVAGLDHQRFEGPSAIAPDERHSASATAFALGLRLGVELFRTTTGRLDLYAQAMAPTGASTDEEEGVVDAWVPSVSLGAGIAF